MKLQTIAFASLIALSSAASAEFFDGMGDGDAAAAGEHLPIHGHCVGGRLHGRASGRRAVRARDRRAAPRRKLARIRR